MNRIRVTADDIRWDSEGHSPRSCGLPSRKYVDMPEDTHLANLYEAVGMALHDLYGFNLFSFVIVITPDNL